MNEQDGETLVVAVVNMAKEILRVEAERDALKRIIEAYGKVHIRHCDFDSEIVHVAFAIPYGVLKEAREPELLFSTAISDAMHKFREFLREHETPVTAAKREVDA